MTSKQRAYLRGLANTIDAIFQVGKGGISPALIKQVDDALEARELIKISVLETAPASAKEIGECLSKETHSVFVQTVGNKITLFRQRAEKSRIELPR